MSRQISSDAHASQLLRSSNGLSVSVIRQSRQKIEMDVLRLHTRITLLQAEEKKANKIIEDTKEKVKSII